MVNTKQEIISDTLEPNTLLDDVLLSGNGDRSDQLKFSETWFAGHHFSRAMRLHRLFRHGSRLVIVPLDHSVTDGPIMPRGKNIDQLVATGSASWWFGVEWCCFGLGAGLDAGIARLVKVPDSW